MIATIWEYENKLQTAMLQSDVPTLDSLLAPDLLFTNHLGQHMSKQDDLDAHQSGALVIDSLISSDQQIRVFTDTAVISVLSHIVGSYAGVASEGDFRFTRVWTPAEKGSWHVIAAHATVLT